jgi:7,8-dihydropterin-6-yl-methyl-4-(beta-D-ribofuranosyl)aminobenzene 5'-phosphate synthase
MNETAERTFSRAVTLREVDGVEIISLVDNTVDFLSTIEKEGVHQVRKWVEERKGREWTKQHFRLPIAEHGFSMLVRVYNGAHSHSILFDTGGSSDGIITNAQGMGLDLSEVECIVLSHGHYDHFGGLLATLKVIDKRNLPIIVHEDMFKTKGVANPDGTVRKHPNFPTDDQVKPSEYVRTKQPHLVADDTVLVTGEIPRRTDFEKGFPQHRVLVNGQWQHDPWILDDRAMVVNVRQKGLVVVSGCAHAGIINTILCAKQSTGVMDVYGVLGGFHLAGKECEQRISQTIEKLKLLDPNLVAPSHCTGWRGIYAIAEALPHAFIWNSVGNLYRFWQLILHNHTNNRMIVKPHK